MSKDAGKMPAYRVIEVGYLRTAVFSFIMLYSHANCEALGRSG